MGEIRKTTLIHAIQQRPRTSWDLSDSDTHNEGVQADDDEDDDQSLYSVTCESPGGIRELRPGRRKGDKKTISLISLYKTSENMARDLRIGPLETRDRRKTFAPEVAETLTYLWNG